MVTVSLQRMMNDLLQQVDRGVDHHVTVLPSVDEHGGIGVVFLFMEILAT